ncbi:unnamed protein product [Adineta ricciae]|uniref:Uncharacterized protein n=1 Tax=Adineta ricciae TaxID=249248 RepID=A0A816D0W7_ADIRI|nr:unnamed protein product [Adineta ricciae]
MSGTNEDEFIGNERSRSGFFRRSFSPHSFDKLRDEDSDYFYKPKRGPSRSKSNITITRPIKRFETVTTLMELLSKGTHSNSNSKVQLNEDAEQANLSKKLDGQKSSPYSSFLSMDGGNSSLNIPSTLSSTFSSRCSSSILTAAESESPTVIAAEPISELIQKIPDPSEEIPDDEKRIYLTSPCHVPAVGINVTTAGVHLVLLELYPQNIDYSTVIFQRYLISLIVNNEHQNWSISNVELRSAIEQEVNFRLFTLTHEEFDLILIRLQSFTNFKASIASSFVLNIALTGEQTNEYERKISSRLNKINLNFDIIQYRIESYMIGLDFFLGNKRLMHSDKQDELIEVFDDKPVEDNRQIYPYILVHAEAGSTFFYIVHTSTRYSVLTSNNLCYKTYANLLRLLQPGFDLKNDEQTLPSTTSFPVRRPPPVSFDFTRQDLCKNCHRSSTTFPAELPLTSFTRLPQRCFPYDYSISKTPHYIYRGWSNRRTLSSDKNLATYDVHTQTDDSFLESSSSQMRLATRRSLLSMFTMNMALTLKLLLKLYPSVHHCILIGEFFQLEKQAIPDLTLFMRSILGQDTPHIYQLKRESLISALGCALPRVYFDVIDDKGIIGNDCID